MQRAYNQIDKMIANRQAGDDKALTHQRHKETRLAHLATQEATYKATKQLISFLEGHTGKTEVTNQLKEIGTPDALKVAEAVNDLHQTIKTHKDTDLSEVTAILKSVLDEAKAIPKELVKIDIPGSVEVSNQVDYSEQFTNMLKAIKAIKLVAETPKVEVKPADVIVQPTDYTPLNKGLQAVEKAVKALVFPEYKTDNTKVEKLLTKQNKLLDEFLDTVPTGGGSSGGRVSPYSNADGMPEFVTLNSGALPVTSATLAERCDYSSSSVIYTATAPVGTVETASSWTITKYDLSSSSNAHATIATNAAWTDRLTETYN